MNVYDLALEGWMDRPVRLLVTDDGRALCMPGSVNLGPSRADAGGLKITGDGLSGVIVLACEPDAWFPKDQKTLNWRIELDVQVRDGRIEGRTDKGGVTGLVAEEVPVPEIAHWVLTIEQAAPGWSGHLGRGELTVSDAEFRLRSPVAHSWEGRVEQASLTLAGGRVCAMVGMQSGGTDLGGERVAYDMAMTRIGDVLAGVCIVTGEDGQSARRGLRGRIVAGKPAWPRPVVAATGATLAIDVRGLRAATSVRPWKTVDVSPARLGHIAGFADLDGDGQAEILGASAENLAITGVRASRMDGRRLWQWGELGAGRSPCDIPVQVADLDGDGREEVYVAGRGEMVVLECATGKELRRWPLPPDLQWSDCIVIANLRGLARPGDLLIKDRHQFCYAFTAMGEPLWRWQDPAGRSIAHHPLVFDDGRVLIGWTMLGPDGRPRWELQTDRCDFRQGHLDSADVIGPNLIAVCYDEANGLALVDGDGRLRWEVTGSHFHTLCTGRFLPGVETSHVLCTLARLKHWCWRAWLMDVEGRLAAEYLGLYLPAALDWDGDGVLELIGGSGIVFRATGEPLVNLVDEQDRALGISNPEAVGHLPDVVDLDGDGRGELLLFDGRETLRIYRPEGLSPRPGFHRIGTWNHTAYCIPKERT